MIFAFDLLLPGTLKKEIVRVLLFDFMFENVDKSDGLQGYSIKPLQGIRLLVDRKNKRNGMKTRHFLIHLPRGCQSHLFSKVSKRRIFGSFAIITLHTSPLATDSPGTNSSGYTLSKYHLKDLHLSFSRRCTRELTSP